MTSQIVTYTVLTIPIKGAAFGALEADSWSDVCPWKPRNDAINAVECRKTRPSKLKISAGQRETSFSGSVGLVQFTNGFPAVAEQHLPVPYL